MKQDINKIVGMNIRAERVRKCLTSSELARKINTTEISLRKWETGKTKIPIHILVELSKILECSIESFFIGL